MLKKQYPPTIQQYRMFTFINAGTIIGLNKTKMLYISKFAEFILLSFLTFFAADFIS